jgi:RNA recognition motif-containing protein
VTKLFVANLNYAEVDESKLFELFARFVDVRSAKIVRDADGQSKGFAFIELLHDQDLEAALELDGYSLCNRTIRVAVAKSKNDSSGY